MLAATTVPTTEGPSPKQEQDSQDSSTLENRQSQPEMPTAHWHRARNLPDSHIPSVAKSNQGPSSKRTYVFGHALLFFWPLKFEYESFHVTKSPSSAFPFNNCVAVHPSDFPKELVHVLVNGYPLTVWYVNSIVYS